MVWLSEHQIVLFLLGMYLLLVVWHAASGWRATKSLQDYYVGGRRMGGIALGLSFFATYASTNSFVGFAGQAYAYGAPWLLIAPLAVIFAVLAWVMVAPRLRSFTRRLDSITIPDFIGFRFESQVSRVSAATIVLCASLFYMVAVFKGVGHLFESFLGVPYEAAIFIVLFIVTVYTMVGGFISVVKTDSVQGLMMIGASVVLFWGALQAAGGIGAFQELQSDNTTASLFKWDSAMSFPMLLGIMVASTMKLMVEPRQLSRFYALADDKAVYRGALVSTVAFLIVYTMLVPVGLLAHKSVPGIEKTDQVVPMLLTSGEIFHPFVSSLMLVALLAAAMSSLDSVLLVTASTFERDIMSAIRGQRAESKSIRATRQYVALFAVLTALVAINPPGSIVALTSLSGTLYAACFTAPILWGLYWRKGNGTSSMTAICVGVLTLLLWQFLPWASFVHQIFPATVLSTFSYITVALFTDSVRSKSVQSLFEKVELKRD